MIRNTDGTAYKLSGCFKQFDSTSNKHDLFNAWDAEAIRIGGSPIFYYECLVPPNTIDPVYWESRGKIWRDTPIVLNALYEPMTSPNYMDEFGMGAGPDTVIFELNYREVLSSIGHAPKIDSRIFTPHRSENWKIVQRNIDQFTHWSELRLQLICDKFQESLTTGEGRVTQKNPDISGSPNRS